MASRHFGTINPWPELTEDEKTMLRGLVISDPLPTIVTDFQVMLDYVIENPLMLTKLHLPPMAVLNEINVRLTHPIQHGLTRPQLKSLPNVAGLYLLLRATGLGIVKTVHGKPHLVLDEVTLSSWPALNEVERYLSLLESWLLRGNPQILGERGGSFWNSPLTEWNHFFGRLQRDDWPPPNATDLLDEVRHFPGLYHLALMEMFGFLRLERLSSVAGKGWQVSSITPTLLGKLMLRTLMIHASQDTLWFELDNPDLTAPGVLRPFLQNYFPEWQNVIMWPTSDFRGGLFVFKVALDKNLWRRITISGEHSLDDLSDMILAACSFDHDHLYRFLYKNRMGVEIRIYHPYMDEVPSTSEVRIGDIPLMVGESMLYNYDFGDNWYFELTLEQIDPLPKGKRPRPKVIEKKGKAPEQYPSYDGEW